MMKKLAKLTALLAVAALLFGAVGCSDDDDDDIAVTGVTLDKPTASVKVGGTVTLTATVAPANATNKTVTWSSSNPSTATVNDGVVTGVAAGTATITVTTEDGNKTAVCAVAVTNDNTDGGGNEGENQGGGDNGVTTITINSDDYKDEFIELGFGSTAAPIAEDVPIELESGVTLTLLALKSNMLGDKAKNDPSFKLHDSAGFIIKNCAVKLSGIKGNVKVTVDWRLNGAKGENDRYMLMKVGNNNVMEKGNVDSNDGSFNTEQPSLVDTFDFGTEGGDIYIGASNELALRSIKIESAQ